MCKKLGLASVLLLLLTGCCHVGSQDLMRLNVLEIQHQVISLEKSDIKTNSIHMEILSILEILVNEIEVLKSRLENYEI